MYFFQTRQELIGLVICIGCAAVLGLYPSAARGAYQAGANITFIVLTTTFCRFLVLYTAALVKKQRPFRQFAEFRVNLYTGVLQAIIVIGILAGSYFMPGAVVIIIIYSYPMMLLLFSAWRGEMVLNAVNIASTLTGFIGLGLVVNIAQYETVYPVAGIALVFTAALAAFLRTYLFGQQSHSRHPLVIGAETFAIAFFLLLLMIPWQAPALPHTAFGLAMSAIAAVSLTLGTVGMFYGIACLGSYKFGMFMKLEPVFTMLFGIVLVNDHLAVMQYIGIAVVILSLVSLQLFDKQTAKTAS